MFKHLTENQLKQRLVFTLASIIGLILLIFISLQFFAPKIGFLFGFLSRHRNEPDTSKNVKPNPPIFTDIPEATKEKSIGLKGYAQPGTTIVLYVNGPENQRTTTGTDGIFNFSDIALFSGRNTVYAKTLDARNNESDLTDIHTITVDTDKPDLVVLEPSDGSTVKNLDKRIKIRGTVNEKATIVVNGNTAIQRPDLSFEFLLGVNEGSVEIKVAVTDLAGNKVEKTLKVRYEKTGV